MKIILAPFSLAFCLAACSSEPSEPPEAAPETAAPSPTAATGTPPPSPPPPPPDESSNLLTIQGLGALEIGQKVPAGSGWAERGAQISDTCRTVSSPAFPGVYAIVDDGRVRRITVGERSDVKLVEGIGVGAIEAEVRAAFPGFRETPHKYVDAPGKYLTAPNAESGEPALRFEIGTDGRVSLVHVGTMPVLGYVEGCA